MKPRPHRAAGRPCGSGQGLAMAAVAWAAACLGAPAWAQGSPALLLTPTLGLSQIVTNNASPSGQQRGESDAITRATVGLNLRSRSGAAQASLDYSLSGLAYARQSDLNTTQQTLNANLSLAGWERQGTLQASAQIGQGAVSAFGAQPGATGLPNANATEVRTLSLAPRWQGPLFGDLQLTASGQLGLTEAQGGTQGDSTSRLLTLQLGPRQGGPLGWSVQASRQAGSFSAGTAGGSSRVYGSLSRALDDLDLRLSATAGYERGNQASVAQRSGSTWGLGMAWTPTPRTSADLKYEQRLFGPSHVISLQHRTPLTVWRLSSSRALNDSGSSLSPAGSGSLYDLYFAQFASVEPDPVRRASLVTAFLAQNGLSGAAVQGAGFLRSAATVENRQEVSVAWRAARSTATLSYGRSQSRRAISGLAAADDLALSPTVDTETWSLGATHRLTPSLTAGLSTSLLSGAGAALGQSNRQRLFSAQIGGPAGPQASWSLVLRRVLYDTRLVPYGESSAIASITLRF